MIMSEYDCICLCVLMICIMIITVAKFNNDNGDKNE